MDILPIKKPKNEKYPNRVTSALSNPQYLQAVRAAELQGLNMCAYIRQALEAYGEAVFQMHNEPEDEIGTCL